MNVSPADLGNIRVSYHAVTRYVQRILDITVPGEWETEKRRAIAHAAAAGMTIGAVRALIWTPGIELAARCGFTQVANRQFFAAISQPGGIITTICDPYKHGVKRTRVLSDKKLRARSKRVVRRLKRRPSVTDVLVHGAGPDEE